MASSVKIYLAKSKFRVNKDEVTLPDGASLNIVDPAAEGSMAEPSLLVEVQMPSSSEVKMVLRQANKIFTGPNGENTFPEVRVWCAGPKGMERNGPRARASSVIPWSSLRASWEGFTCEFMELS